MRLTEVIREVLSRVQHDLKNPLTVLSVTLRDDTNDPELKAAALQGLDRIQSLANDLNRIALLLNAKPVPCRLEELARECAQGIRRFPIEVIPSEDSDFPVLADPLIFVQTLSSLISTLGAKEVKMYIKSAEVSICGLNQPVWESTLNPLTNLFIALSGMGAEIRSDSLSPSEPALIIRFSQA